MNWYQLEANQIFTELNTLEDGLTEAEARERLQQFGPNRLPEGERISRLKILLHQFKSPLIYILLIAAVVTAFLEEYKDTGVILAILLINAIVGFIQEYKACHAMGLPYGAYHAHGMAEDRSGFGHRHYRRGN